MSLTRICRSGTAEAATYWKLKEGKDGASWIHAEVGIFVQVPSVDVIVKVLGKVKDRLQAVS